MMSFLDPETMYIITDRDDSEHFARTPDGVGCYWYDEDQWEEAKGDVCDHKRIMHFESHADFDQYRNGEHLV